MLQNTYSFLLF